MLARHGFPVQFYGRWRVDSSRYWNARDMASTKTLNASNLEALGAARLAALLMEISDGNAAAKRRLRLELAGAQSPAELVKEIRKRQATLARSRSFVDWQNRKTLVDDLETQRQAIVDHVAKSMPAEGLDLMWRFLDLASPVLGRCDDSNGTVSGIFQTAIGDLGEITGLIKTDPKQLGDQVFNALTQNDYGQFDGLIQVLKPALGHAGLEHLKQRMIALSAEPVRRPGTKERQVIGWGSGGEIYADDLAERARVSTVRLALQEIADAQGDVDAFVAQYDQRTRKVPTIAAEITQRLLAAGRPDEAWRTIEAAEHRQGGWPDFDWEDARIDVLEALGRGNEAQAARWACFEKYLSTRHLRDYLKRLPDFDDFEAEERALGHVERYGDLLQAVLFLVSWPSLDRAARIAIERAKELDGNHYEVLTPAADSLAGKYPLSATLLLRAMIDFTLTQARSSRYGHAARHLRTCGSLAPAISDFGTFEAHDAYVSRLRREHGRKTAFWSLAS
jgi:hypothetical protein